MTKAMWAQGVEWSEDYRHAAGVALKEVLESRMFELVDRNLDDLAEREIAERRNGSDTRRLMTEMGVIELAVSRTRRFSGLVPGAASISTA